VITYTWKVLDTTATNQDDRVLLKVVTLTGDVGVNLLAVSQTHTCYLTHSRIRLLRSSSVNANANATALWA
jgi:hypothetical protein